MSSLTVLAVDNHPQYRQEIAILMDFMELSTTVCDYAGEYVDNIDVILFALHHGDTHWSDELNRLLTHYTQCPVIFLLDNIEQPAPILKKSWQVRILGTLHRPIKQQILSSLLSRVEAFSQKQGSAKKLSKADQSYLETHLIGHSPAMLLVKKLITQVATTQANVLILGESGTGKEVVAQCLHHLSERRSKPYVPINCGAIPAELLESELFGHEKGAFTGALSARQGRFELAKGGTLFLDEIGDMPLPMQVKILRVLQERTFERVGSNKSIKTDVRIIAATHRNLEDEVRKGHFREDLFYRLNVFPIEIPPLKERSEDLPELIAALGKRQEEERDLPVILGEDAILSLMQHNWSGNVRELANLLERLGIMYPEERIGIHDLPERYQYEIKRVEHINSALSEMAVSSVTNRSIPLADHPLEPAQQVATTINTLTCTEDIDHLPGEGLDLREHLNRVESELIKKALNEANGVISHAAKLLKMRRTTLAEKIRKYGLSK